MVSRAAGPEAGLDLLGGIEPALLENKKRQKRQMKIRIRHTYYTRGPRRSLGPTHGKDRRAAAPRGKLGFEVAS